MTQLYLSHGMGVNSTALMLLLEDFGVEFESVFVDVGAEYPETYEYLQYLQGQGYNITVLKPDVEGFSNLYEYCKTRRIVPGQFQRLCTSKFKIRPLAKYIKTPCIMFIAIAADERHRVFSKPIKRGVLNSYPLVNYGIDRRRCIEIIKEHGLKVPRKSGCWLCPFARKEEIRQLYLSYPELYEKRKELERLASERYGKQVYIKHRKTTEEWATEGTPSILQFVESNSSKSF